MTKFPASSFSLRPEQVSKARTVAGTMAFHIQRIVDAHERLTDEKAISSAVKPHIRRLRTLTDGASFCDPSAE